MEQFELSIWKGDWGLPSIDPECLQVLVYAKFSNIALKINKSSNLFKTPNGRLPVLKSNNITLDKVKDIIGYLRENHYNTEYTLKRKECAKILAYDVMLKQKLFPALQFIWWVDQRNLNELIRPWYCKAIPFPFNFYYPSKFEQEARSMFEALYAREDDMAAIEYKVYSEARKCLTMLSESLGDSNYFFGSEPTELDAIVYSYLAPLLKVPLPNPALQNHLKDCKNLVSFIARISERCFSHDCQEYKAKETAESMGNYSEGEFPHKRRNQILAGLFTVLAMTSYVLSTGIIKVSIKEDEITDLRTKDIIDDE
ncbi:metaxin-1 isoform X1 [Megachile rotundata]|uniref:metaxin-1 isoform X1 n=1 Tax=Megachile rotundata TaxID=143995 RepID=UPI000258DA85|nr:PREDICTED: metaxin-1 [Megachile rotundata]